MKPIDHRRQFARIRWILRIKPSTPSVTISDTPAVGRNDHREPACHRLCRWKRECIFQGRGDARIRRGIVEFNILAGRQKMHATVQAEARNQVARTGAGSSRLTISNSKRSIGKQRSALPATRERPYSASRSQSEPPQTNLLQVRLAFSPRCACSAAFAVRIV